MGGTARLVAFLASVLPPEVAKGAAAAAAAHLKGIAPERISLSCLTHCTGQTGSAVENDDPRALVKS